jgi:hypothetical protein
LADKWEEENRLRKELGLYYDPEELKEVKEKKKEELEQERKVLVENPFSVHQTRRRPSAQTFVLDLTKTADKEMIKTKEGRGNCRHHVLSFEEKRASREERGRRRSQGEVSWAFL